MSWLGVNLNESLKNIGGQITNLTNQVLAEDLEDEGLYLVICSYPKIIHFHKLLNHQT